MDAFSLPKNYGQGRGAFGKYGLATEECYVEVKKYFVQSSYGTN